IWLFEYGLEMDPGVLNSPDRLNGLALLYGPAVLKGHTLLYGSMQIGRELATIAPVADPNAEVWGVLYRVPRRLADRNGGEHAVLDMAHFATTAHNFFKPIASIVHEGYRNREIGCITYVAIEQVLCQVSLIPVSQASTQPLVQRLAQIARKQKLPNHYLSTYNWQAAPVSGAATHVGLAAPRAVQDTEPLPAIKDKGNSTPASPRLGRDQETTAESLKPSRWLVGLALYLIVMLLAMLTFAVLQDLGMAELTFVSTLTLLGVPWLVVMYGLLGGCVSSLFSLARSRRLRPPLFVTLTWFARPFVGGVLALLSYLLLTSGAFVISSSNARQQPVFLLAGALAGLCEGWLFFRTR
ncbi:MAG: gamma-glutamylcyclotransferase, partial [Ktedonobacteraceae bacterium]|nr:gamma-glutamylcyclotransferase [Ktedonobacteraceae bacterium]